MSSNADPGADRSGQAVPAYGLRVEAAAAALLALTFFIALLWAIIAKRVPDEMVYFNEILDLASEGTTAGHSGHIVGVFAWSGAAAVKVLGLVGIAPLMAVRFMGVLCVVGTGVLAYWAAGTAMPAWPHARLAAIPLVTLNPMFTFIGASANSDTMLSLWAALLFCGLVWLVRVGFTRSAVIAVIAGLVLGALTKERIWVLTPLIPLAALLRLGGRRLLTALHSHRSEDDAGDTRQGFWVRNPSVAEMVVVGTLIVGGVLVGPRLLTAAYTESVPVSAGLFPYLKSLQDVLAWLDGRGTSWLLPTAWANFGYLDVLAPIPIYWIQNALLALGTVGLVFAGAREILKSVRKRQFAEILTRPGTHTLILALVAIASAVYFVAQYEMVLRLSSQGRYLFIAALPVALVLLRGLFGSLPRTSHGLLAAALTFLMVAVNWYCLFYVVLPHYY